MSDSASSVGDGPPRTQIKDFSSKNLNKSYKNHKKSFSIKKGAHQTPRLFVECTSDSGVVVSALKVLKSAFQYPATLVSELPFKAIVSHCSAIADTFKCFNFFKGIKNIYDNRSSRNQAGEKLKGTKLHLRNLGIAGGVFQTVIGGATFTKLLDTFGVLKIAEITNAMGRSSVAGQALAAIAPFSVVTNFLEIGNNIVSIAKASIIIHGNRNKKSMLLANVKYLNPKKANYEDSVSAFIANHIHDIKNKQEAALEKLGHYAEDVQSTAATIDEREIKYQAKLKALDARKNAVKDSLAVVRFFKTIAPKYKLRRAKLDLFSAKETHDKVCHLRITLLNKYECRENKLEAWSAIHEDLEDNGLTANTRQLFADKRRKWCVQSSGLNLKNLQEGIGIAINVLAIITLLASTILFFSGIATIPATLGITSMFLIISLLGFGNELFKKYKKPKVVVVDVTKAKYSPAPAA